MSADQSHTPAAIAANIAAAHAARARFEPLPDGARDLGLAYAAQKIVVQGLIAAGEGDIAGWKVGLTTRRMQEMCGVGQPIAGAVLAGRVRRSAAELSAAAFVRLGLESEIALRVARPLPGGDLASAQVLACLDLACAAFEVVEDRAADYARLDAASIVADNSWNAGVVLGKASPVADLQILTGRAGVLTVNGVVNDRGSSDDVGGDPLLIVAWLARELAARGQALQPGQWVMTGSIVPTRFPNPGDLYRFEVDGLAPVEVLIV